MEAVLDLKAARARLRGDPDASRPLAGRAAALLCAQPCLHTRVAFETVRMASAHTCHKSWTLHVCAAVPAALPAHTRGL